MALSAIAATAGAWLANRRAQPAPQPLLQAGTWLPQRRALQAFALVDTNNRSFDAATLAAQPSLLFFGFTHCPDVCPTTLALLAQLRRQAGLPQLRIIMISVDPQRDTPEVLRQYLAAFDASMVGVTGDVAAIDALARDIGVAVTRVALPGGGYTVDHSATIFLTDRQGRVAAVFTPPFKQEALLADLRSAWPSISPGKTD